ncbi:hypothetical protein acsn021_45120 [Anaerocolumna cellulosilytica]|uniref:Uncharacterized protein n=1 Tax=Anaerocolumna cellulosilytica TaxID=433286 RepID=A0A6S6R0G6_9FIRM|nr:DUF3881 family protein [Anaerocolumna cellulosilytica]MBB5195932.1 hypothetical protein [Anaerocolumna cellulosilytica]BCJ96943.1 hypothetical protein acsn021_45120 [Anaerocolumna cellulosilytica]
MHSFLRAIGFSEITDRLELDRLINLITEEPTEKKTYNESNNKTFAEISKLFSKQMGITVRGEYDGDGKFYMEHYFPYFKSNYMSTKEEVSIIKRVDTDAYTGMCDDVRLGVSLIFYLQNVVDYLMEGKDNKQPDRLFSIYLSALSVSGKILLPMEHDEKLAKNNSADVLYRRQLIAEAKKGNQEAIDSLTIDDIDMYAMISRRAKFEDIYTIVETSFTPYGSESDNYSILGIITDMDTLTNEVTGEELYVLTISCNDVIFQVLINKKDLYGEPVVGRRFKGNIWLQGNIDFNSEKCLN